MHGDVMERVEGGQRLGMGVSVAVVDAARDERHRRRRGGCEGSGRRRVRTVVADLQHVDRRDEAAADEQLLDRRLRIAGEQDGEPSVAQDADQRAVVDVAVEERSRGVGIGREQDLEAGRGIEGHDVPGAGEGDPDAACVGIGQQAVVRRVGVRDPGVQHETDPVAGEHLNQPENVIRVRMAEHQDVDLSDVEGERTSELSQRALGVRPAVDQHRRPVGRLDEDRVALADVERRDVQPSVRLGGDGDGGEDDEQRRQRAAWAQCPARETRRAVRE